MSSSPQPIVELLQQLSRTGQFVYFSDRLFTAAQTLTFVHDPGFLAAQQRGVTEDWERNVLWRLHTLMWASKTAMSLPGDFVQCGVWRGFYTAAFTAYCQFAQSSKTLYAYDSFAGIPAHYDTHQRNNPEYHTNTIYDDTCQRFTDQPNIRVIRGIVPDAFATTCPEQIAFCLLNLDSGVAEAACLRTLWPRIVSRGMVIIEGYLYYPEYREIFARDGVLQDLGISILELATGQGLIIKA